VNDETWVYEVRGRFVLAGRSFGDPRGWTPIRRESADVRIDPATGEVTTRPQSGPVPLEVVQMRRDRCRECMYRKPSEDPEALGICRLCPACRNGSNIELLTLRKAPGCPAGLWSKFES
jgi:hypothetical protein